MVYAKHTTVFVLFIICSATGWTQKTYRSCYGFDCREKKWSMSVFTGYGLSAAGQDIKAGMEDAGWKGKKPVLNSPVQCFPHGHYLRQTTGLSWSIQSRYNLSGKSAFELSAGNSFHSTIEGFDLNKTESELRIKSDQWNVAFNYIWRTGRGNGGFTIGPVLSSFKSVADYPDQKYKQPSVTSAIRAGFNVGYTHSLIQKKSWFLAMKVNYTWMPPAEIGPYTVKHNGGMDQIIAEPGYSTFEKASIGLESLQFGLTTGWRF
jgi:hypothetical protein